MTFQSGAAWKGNALGRPRKNEEMRAELRRALAVKDPVTGLTDRAAVALALVGAAKNGNVEAIKHVFDRMDGKVQTEAVVEHGGRVEIAVTYSRKAPDRAQE